MKPRLSRSSRLSLAAAALLSPLALASCSGPSTPEPPPPAACAQDCQDAVVVRALRETIRIAFNLGLQGEPVGEQDKTLPCPEGGKVHITGTATTDASTGTNIIDLTYDFAGCRAIKTLSGRDGTYDITWTGVVVESGKISNLSGSTTALVFSCDSLVFTGNITDSAPPLAVEDACKLTLTQDGSTLSGTLCGRKTGFSF
jgi:hypothetical protein